LLIFLADETAAFCVLKEPDARDAPPFLTAQPPDGFFTTWCVFVEAMANSVYLVAE